MAATQIGTDTLVFGSTDETWGFFENLTFTEQSEKTEVMDADGDIKDVTFHGKKTEVTGTYVFRAKNANSPDSHVGDGTAITISNSGDGDFPTGNIYIHEAGTEYTKADFKKVSFSGTIYPDLAS